MLLTKPKFVVFSVLVVCSPDSLSLRAATDRNKILDHPEPFIEGQTSEEDIAEIRRSQAEARETAKRVRAGDLDVIRQELESIRNNGPGLGVKFGITPVALPDIIALINNGSKAPPPPGSRNFSTKSPRDRGVELFFETIDSEEQFPEESRLWARRSNISDPTDETVAGVLEWWEHNKESVAAGKYAEAKWLHRSYALDLDEALERKLEKDKQLEIAICQRDRLPYAHLETELKELEQTRDERIKRRTALRLQQEKETARRTGQVEEQKERENRREKSTLSPHARDETSAPASNIIRWSLLAAIPILGGIYLILRKRFPIPR